MAIKVYALDAYSGRLRWKYQSGGAIDASPAVADAKVYIASLDGKLYVLDGYTADAGPDRADWERQAGGFKGLSVCPGHSEWAAVVEVRGGWSCPYTSDCQ
jgi:outer membrane protein assembly factor BamB